MNGFWKFIKGILLRGETSDPTGTIVNGSIWHNSTVNKLKAYLGGSTREILTNDQAQTVTSKTIVVANNTITTAASGNLAATELNAALAELQGDIDTVNALADGKIYVGNVSNVAAEVTMTGDVTITNAGVSSISSGVIVNDDINASAAIAHSKMAALTASRAMVTDGSGAASVSSVTSTELGQLSGVGSAVAGISDTATLSNKSLVDSTTLFIDNTDNTKKAKFRLDDITSGATRQFTLPDTDGVVLTNTSTQINITGKTFEDSTTYFSDNIDNSKKAQFQVGSITTATTRTFTFPDHSGTFATIAGTQVLTNKDYDGGTAADTSRITVPKNTKTNLDGLTRKEATVVYATDESQLYVDTGSELVPVGSGAEFVATAGENLTAGEIVYISLGNPTDAGRTAGRIYKVDRSNDYRMEFVGFVVATATSGNPVRVKSSGIIDGLAGLTAGSLYYADSTTGAITATAPTTSGVWSVPVGTAISSTELVINTNGNADAAYVEDGNSYFDMSNNVSAQNVTGLSFSTSLDRGVIINYSINRVNTGPSSEYVQVGRLTLGYRSTAATWFIQNDYAGDTAGVTFSVDASGQVQYTSTNVSGTQSQFRMRWSYVRLDQ